MALTNLNMFSQFDTNDDFRESSTHVKNYKSTVYFLWYTEVNLEIWNMKISEKTCLQTWWKHGHIV